MSKHRTTKYLLTSIALGSLLGGVWIADQSLGGAGSFFAAPAYAEGHGGSGNGEGGQGSQSGQDNQGGSGQGQGGPDETSDGKGPQAGSPSPTGSAGGKPVWAQEGIPEVELGRLSVVRSPQKVLDQSLAEALASITPEMIEFYNLSMSEMLDALANDWDNVSLIDSPLQNLALLQDALDGTSDLAALGVTNDVDTLLAVFLGVASDKTLAISTDTVIAVTTILGTPVTGDDADALAAAAEAVRDAVETGHG